MSSALRLSVLVLVMAVGLSSCEKDQAGLGNLVALPIADVGLIPNKYYSVCADQIGGLYLLQETETENMIMVGYSRNGSDWTFEEYMFLQDAYRIQDRLPVKATDDGSVWLLGSTELVRFKDGVRHESYNLDFPSASTGRFIQITVNENNVWLLHNRNGLYGVNQSLGQLVRITDPSTQNHDYSNMVADSDNNIWISKQYYEDNIIGLTADGTWIHPSDPDSTLACPTCNEFFNHYKPVWKLTADRTGAVYMFVSSKFVELENSGLSIIASPNGPNHIARMFADQEEEIWMHSIYDPSSNSSLNSFVYRYEGSSAATYFDATELFEGNVLLYDSTVDDNNNILVGTNKGIVVYNGTGVYL